MIILRKLAPASVIELGTTLSGLLNDSNLIFTTEHNYISGSIVIDYNGQVLHSPSDFTESAANQITLKYITPKSGSILKATYEKDLG